MDGRNKCGHDVLEGGGRLVNHFPQTPGAWLIIFLNRRRSLRSLGSALRARRAVARSGPDSFLSLRRRALAPPRIFVNTLSLPDISCFR